jgi:hypothetical protein
MVQARLFATLPTSSPASDLPHWVFRTLRDRSLGLPNYVYRELFDSCGIPRRHNHVSPPFLSHGSKMNLRIDRLPSCESISIIGEGVETPG